MKAQEILSLATSRPAGLTIPAGLRYDYRLGPRTITFNCGFWGVLNATADLVQRNEDLLLVARHSLPPRGTSGGLERA